MIDRQAIPSALELSHMLRFESHVQSTIPSNLPRAHFRQVLLEVRYLTKLATGEAHHCSPSVNGA